LFLLSASGDDQNGCRGFWLWVVLLFSSVFPAPLCSSLLSFLFFFFLSICLSPLCYCFESGKTSSLCFCSWSSFLQSSALSVLVMKKSVQCWLLLSKLGLLFCSICGLRFIGSWLCFSGFSFSPSWFCLFPSVSPGFSLCSALWSAGSFPSFAVSVPALPLYIWLFLLCSMPSFSIFGSSSLPPLLLACSSQSPLVLFPPLIFGPSSSVAEAFSGFCLLLYSRFFVQFSLLFFSVFGLIFRFILPLWFWVFFSVL